MAKWTQTISVQQPEAWDQYALRKTPVQKRAKKTVDRILDTAAVLVDEIGVVAFTTNLLARRSGIRIRTIYRYFPSKIGILMALVVRLNDDSADQLQSFAELADPERDWRELIDYWIDELMEWTREQPGARLLMAWSHSIPELMMMQEKLDDEWGHRMAAAMRGRGVDLPPKQLYAVCRNFSETLDSLSVLAASDAQDCTAELVEEARRMLVAYLAVYLD